MGSDGVDGQFQALGSVELKKLERQPSQTASASPPPPVLTTEPPLQGKPGSKGSLSANVVDQLLEYTAEGALSGAPSADAAPGETRRSPVPGERPLARRSRPAAQARPSASGQSPPPARSPAPAQAMPGAAQQNPARGIELEDDGTGSGLELDTGRAAPEPSPAVAFADTELPVAAPQAPPRGGGRPADIELEDDGTGSGLELDTGSGGPAPSPAPPTGRPGSGPRQAGPSGVGRQGGIPGIIQPGSGAAVPPTMPAVKLDFVVAAPPLPPSPGLPAIVPALPTKGGSIVDRITYGLKAPKVVQVQKQVIQHLAAQVVRLRRLEQEFVAALGRAARKHAMLPVGVEELVEAAAREEEHAAKVAASSPPGSPGGPSSLEQQKAKLVTLQLNHASLLKRVEKAKAEVAEGEKNLNQLKAKEESLKRPPPMKKLTDEEKAARVKEYEAVVVQRKEQAAKLMKLRDGLVTVQRPVADLDQKISQLKASVAQAEAAGEDAAPVGGGGAAEGKGDKGLHDLDEEIGRAVLREAPRFPALQPIVAAVSTCHSRIQSLEKLQKEQQAEIDNYDEGRARFGFWVVIGAALGLLLFVLSLGEAIRQCGE